MKILITCAAFFLIAVCLFLSCKKRAGNGSPIARAGADTIFTLSSCAQIINVDLDGSGSTDPDDNIVSYSWRKISGRAGLLKFPTSAKARVESVSAGEYAFELSVKDAGGLVSTDTVLISVKAPAPQEYNLDITIVDTFSFINNYESCYYGPPCHPNDFKEYYDLTTISGKATLSTIGEFSVYFSEYADTAASKYASNSYISISNSSNSASIYGTSSVTLKKLIQQGGGTFSGTFTVGGGSAQRCNPTVFNNIHPLNVIGSLDTTTRKVTFRIYGKTSF